MCYYSGWTSEDAPDEGRLKAIGDGMSLIIQQVHGKVYTSQKAIQLYRTSGTARDWFYSEDANEGNTYRSVGYTVELRDTGQYGFLLPPEQVQECFLYLLIVVIIIYSLLDHTNR